MSPKNQIQTPSPGNDIVDLKDIDFRESLYRPRIRERVFSPAELEILSESKNSHHQGWIFWALKEAAFKAIVRTSPGTPFHWRKYDASTGEGVRYEDRFVPCSYEVTDDYIHAFTVHQKSHPSVHCAHRVGLFSDYSPEDTDFETLKRREKRALESRAVREMSLHLARDTWGLILQTGEDGEGYPVLKDPETGLVYPVSFSHHGRFIAVHLCV